MVPTFAVTSLGPSAHHALCEGARGRVVTVFATSLHLAIADAMVSVVAATIGNGPLNVLVDETPAGPWRPHGMREGMAAVVAGGLLTIEDAAAFDLAHAGLWVPAPWPATWQPQRVNEALRALAAEALPRLPADGLAVVIFGEPPTTGLGGALARRALLATATISDWLAEALEPGRAPEMSLAMAAQAAVHGLLGLGPGLTPSGDDLLAGLVVALRAAGASEATAAMAQFIADAPPDATTVLSRGWLAAAAEGLPVEALADLIRAVLAGETSGFADALDRIDGMGHTSGWDMLAGATMGLAAVAAARNTPST